MKHSIINNSCNWEYKYADIIEKLYIGEQKYKPHYGYDGPYTHKGRNGNTTYIFGTQLQINGIGFPILQGREIYYKQALGELAAFLAQATTKKEFESFGCTYWNKYADADGNLNIDYGKLWRNFEGVDQIANVVHKIKTEPNSRRIIMTGWHPKTIEYTSLPCCHMLYQWQVRDHYLDMIWYQRSVDILLGFPYDLIVATALNIIIAEQTGYLPGYITYMLGNCHLYDAHRDMAKQYLEQFKEIESKITTREFNYTLSRNTTVDNFTPDKFYINYMFNQPAIKIPLIQ